MVGKSHDQDGSIRGNECLILQQNLGGCCPNEGLACSSTRKEKEEKKGKEKEKKKEIGEEKKEEERREEERRIACSRRALNERDVVGENALQRVQLSIIQGGTHLRPGAEDINRPRILN